MALVLLALPLSPAWAASACPGASQTAQCHRMEMGGMAHHHHCDAMASEDQDAAASDAATLVAGDSGKCPMNCCVQGNVQTGTIAAATSLLPQLVAAGKELHFTPVMFASAGFSSHTDRGPPAVDSLA